MNASQSIPTTALTPRLMKIPQAVDYSGESRSKLYAEHQKGNIAFVKMDGSTRIEKCELDRYIDAKICIAA